MIAQSPVNCRLEGAIATITMDDGKANVMSAALLTALDAALDQARELGFVGRVVPAEEILDAAGDQAM